MVKKLHINESVNLMADKVYDNIALLGYACTLAANDLHHIHLCAEGDKFQEIHETADQYLSDIRSLGDFCLELAKEGGLNTYSETYALDVIKDSGNDWKVEEADNYNFNEAFTAMSNILTDLSQFIVIIQEMEGVTTDVSSELDNYLRNFTKNVNYFIAKKLDKGIITDETELEDTNEAFSFGRTNKYVPLYKDINSLIDAAYNIADSKDMDKVTRSLFQLDNDLYKQLFNDPKRFRGCSRSYIGKEIGDELAYKYN